MRVIISSIEELPALASKITKAYSNRIIAFYGDMSSGKTTFIKYLCQELGVDPSFVNSPTYAIVNEYEARGDKLIFHFDFFRIKDENEAYEWAMKIIFILIITVLLNGRKKLLTYYLKTCCGFISSLRQICVYLQ